jgi:predicted component of type VI protein secretion system
MAGKYQLVMRSGPVVGAVYPLEGETIGVGRDASNGIQINDAEMSRRHARLQFQGGKYVIEDLGSTNGTFVNGQRLSAPHVLRPGDVVSFGEQIVLGFESTDYDPGATLASPHSAKPARVAAIPPPPPAQVYSGQMPASPMPVGRKNNPLPIVIGVGVVVLICACALFLWWVDANSMWCTFLPFLGGCP